MRRAVWLPILCILSLVAACAKPATAVLRVPAPSPIATVAPTPTQAPTPTPTPTLTPEPTPKITDEWYVERTESMRHYLEAYGGYEGEALDARIRALAIDPDKPMIALTFDDGPMPGVTDAIVDILKKYDCRATFFILGVRTRNGDTLPLMQKILGEGNEIGSHTWKHLNLKTASGGEIMASLRQTNKAVYDLTGYTIRLLRPPGGRVNANVERYAGRLDMSVVLWSQSGNVHEKDPAKIAENVQRQIVNGKELADGDIVLLHDTKERMIEAVEIMVPALLHKGYQLVTVGELLSLSETGLVPGMRYYKQNP